MNDNILASFFSTAAAKRLTAVEVDPARSNQHEFNAPRQLRDALGTTTTKVVIPTVFLYFDDSEEPIAETSHLTYYDARANHPTRSEYRIYYPSNTVMAKAATGDVWLFAHAKSGPSLVAVARQGSSSAAQLPWVFGIELDGTESLVGAPASALTGAVTPVTASVLMDLLGIEIDLSDDDDRDLVKGAFGTNFPTTAEFSAFARSHSVAPDPMEDPDGALLAWWETEFRLFQAFERGVVEERLTKGFAGVEEFLGFSLSVQNRRKSRSGHAFENHLAAVLDSCKIVYARGALTERKAKPDFLFPSQAAYNDPSFPSDTLRMLAAKTTAKDRWRQLLAEADRIVVKHLVTLQSALSEGQTNEMRELNVQLVMPRGVRDTGGFSDGQKAWIWTIAEFIQDVRSIDWAWAPEGMRVSRRPFEPPSRPGMNGRC